MAAVVVIVAAILLAHAVAPPSYQWARNTISELGAQGYSNSWIMRSGFIVFGALLAIGAAVGAMHSVRENWPQFFIGLYGAGVLLSGVFSTAPLVQGVAYSSREASFHSAMATAAGIAISGGMVAMLIADKQPRRKMAHLIALVATMLLSAAFGVLDPIAGVIQRLLYSVGFAWLVFIGIGVRRPGESA